MALFDRVHRPVFPNIAGWDLSDSLERHSVIHALKKAVAQRKPPFGLLIHSDRDVQYASKDFRSYLREHGYIQSMKPNWLDLTTSRHTTIENGDTRAMAGFPLPPLNIAMNSITL